MSGSRSNSELTFAIFTGRRYGLCENIGKPAMVPAAAMADPFIKSLLNIIYTS
jgi:hypothetical protein